MTWHHGVVLLVAAAAVQASTLLSDATRPPLMFLAPGSSGTSVYFAVSVVLAVADGTEIEVRALHTGVLTT